MWRINYLLEVLDQRLIWQKRVKPKMPKWRDFPWSKEAKGGGGSSKKLGDRGDLTNEQVEAWLDTIRPPKSPEPDAPEPDVVVVLGGPDAPAPTNP